MGDTEISWTHRPGTVGRTWNPVQGCRRVSAGCERCYAERLAARFAENGWSQGLINLKTRKWNGVGRLATHKLTEPLRWRSPATVFVNSMSDLFYDAFSNEEIAAVFGVMAAAPQHTFQILTKRATRMREWFQWIGGGAPADDLCRCHADDALTALGLDMPARNRLGMFRETPGWPLPNVWLGVSVENQEAAGERIPALLATPAAVRFLSCEPLLGPIDFGHQGPVIRWLRPDSLGVSWVIAGCESGPGRRDCEVAWLRSLRDQCAAARVPFFLKQARAAQEGGHRLYPSGQAARTPVVDVVAGGESSDNKGGGVIERPYLDGRQHLEFPEVARG